jgi:hypothetical protein
MNTHLLLKIAVIWGVHDADAQRIQCSLKKKKKKLQIESVGQKISTVWGNFSQGAGTPGTQRAIGFSQLAVKGLK